MFIFYVLFLDFHFFAMRQNPQYTYYSNEPYLRSFQYKVLNSILYTNELLCKIGYVSNPNCSFCHQTIETISHIFFDCSF